METSKVSTISWIESLPNFKDLIMPLIIAFISPSLIP